VRASKVIFTNEFEMRYARRYAPWIRRRSELIPIGNNISLSAPRSNRPPGVVTYFGLIRPRKGLEEVLEIARILKERGSGVRVRIVGLPMPGREQYLTLLRGKAQDLPIQWVLGLDGDNLARALAETEIAYLPFVDGASERRSSLIAMMSNRAAVITTRGPHTPAPLGQAVVFASTASEAAASVEEICLNPEWRHSLQSKAAEYAVRFSWESIAAQHIAIYRDVISSGQHQ
jgi:glycosyltransferase involved in cell wall biosynthesis